MNINELYRKLKKDKGFTVNFELNIPDNLKYIVSLKKFESSILIKDLSQCVFGLIIRCYQNIVRSNLIGCWIDNNLVYFDLSVNCKEKKKALNLGMMNNQKAIYDFVRQESIYLEQN